MTYPVMCDAGVDEQGPTLAQKCWVEVVSPGSRWLGINFWSAMKPLVCHSLGVLIANRL